MPGQKAWRVTGHTLTRRAL